MGATYAGMHDEGAWASGLRACDQLLASHLSRVERVFGGDGLGVVDLPALGSELLVDAQIRVAAVLYWCREVERAGVLPLVEALAEGLARGDVLLPIGAAGGRLLQLWRDRERRWTAAERVALYDRVLGPAGAGVMQGFDTWFALFASVLAEIGKAARDRSLADLQARAARLAVDVGRGVSERAVGIAAFAARDIVAQVREAIEVLREPDLVRALGGGSPWMLVIRHAPRLLGRTPEVSSGIARAQAGAVMLRWIADEASALDTAAARLDRQHPVVHAALAWQAAARGV